MSPPWERLTPAGRSSSSPMPNWSAHAPTGSSMLLRGQSGSNAEVLPLRPAGERFVLLNRAVVQPTLSLGEAGLTSTWRIGPAQYDLGRSYVSIEQRGAMLGLRPLSPCQARAKRQGGDVLFTWIRRTRLGGDSWDVEEVPMAEEREFCGSRLQTARWSGGR